MFTKYFSNFINVSNNNNIERSTVRRVSILSPIVALLSLIFVASCGGGTAMPLEEESRGSSARIEGEGAEAKGTSGSWYVETSSAKYVEGLDYLFKLYTDGNGSYEFVLTVTNYSGGPKHINYNNGQRYNFLVERNGCVLYNWAAGRIFDHATFTDTLQQGQSREFRAIWNGRDSFGNPIPMGMAKFSAIHTKVPPVCLTADGYLNGKYI